MRYLSTLLALSAATAISALTLKINIGAYSPALVVGDGEISFGGTELAEALVNTLAGAFAGTDTARTASLTQAATTSSDGSTVIQPAGAAAEAALPKEKRDAPVEKRGLTGFNAALNFAAGALMTSPEVQLGTGKAGSGVGITVSPGASAGGGTKVGKREEGTTLNLLKIRSFGESN